eukprot:1207341-Amorphochlora_amoeboformis.AAC.1
MAYRVRLVGRQLRLHGAKEALGHDPVALGHAHAKSASRRRAFAKKSSRPSFSYLYVDNVMIE